MPKKRKRKVTIVVAVLRTSEEEIAWLTGEIEEMQRLLDARQTRGQARLREEIARNERQIARLREKLGQTTKPL